MALRNQEIAQRIKELREGRGNPPQPVVATAVGVSLRTYQNWEGGDAKPEYRNLENLAAYFAVSEEFILTGTERKPVQADGTPDPFAQNGLAGSLEQIHRKLDLLLLAAGINLSDAPAEAPEIPRYPRRPDEDQKQAPGA